MPLVLPGTAMVLALSSVCLRASIVLTSGFGAPARTAAASGTRAKSTSVPAAMRPDAASSARPSLERITTSAGTPLCSWAAIVCGPVPCDAPDPVTTVMPVDLSNSGSTCRYAPEKPPEIITLSCASEGLENASDVAAIAVSRVIRKRRPNERVFFITVSRHKVTRFEESPCPKRHSNESDPSTKFGPTTGHHVLKLKAKVLRTSDEMDRHFAATPSTSALARAHCGELSMRK